MKTRLRLGSIGVLTTVLGCSIGLAGAALPAIAADAGDMPASITDTASPAPNPSPTEGATEAAATGEPIAVAADEVDPDPLPEYCPPPTSVEVTDLTETGGVFRFSYDPTAANYTQIDVIIAAVPYDAIIPDRATSSYTIPFDGLYPGTKSLEAAATLRCTDAKWPGGNGVFFDLLGEGHPEHEAMAMAHAAASGSAQAAATVAANATAGASATGAAQGGTSTATGSAEGTSSAGGASSAGASASGAAAGSGTANPGNAGGGSGQGSQAGGAVVSSGGGSTPATGAVADSEVVDGKLALTGGELVVPVMVGGALLAAAGIALTVTGRRRARQPSS
ncbi:hypothetical protein [Microbacterium sp. NPDC055665]